MATAAEAALNRLKLKKLDAATQQKALDSADFVNGMLYAIGGVRIQMLQDLDDATVLNVSPGYLIHIATIAATRSIRCYNECN